MSILDKSANKEQLIDILNSMKFPIMGAGGGFAPIGKIGFYDGTIAPEGWLACDGTVYNISDYPELAAHYASHHGASNFYGGNGTTTFAVPDLRGEFLRGTGTNSHTNQGSGANVGVHQDGTVHPTTDNNGSYGAGQIRSIYPSNSIINADSTIGNANGVVGSGGATANLGSSITSRPTNTSFLICVKATVAGDANAHQYSTEEQVVGMTEDGDVLYERTVNLQNINIKDYEYSLSFADAVYDCKAYVTFDGQQLFLNYNEDGYYCCYAITNNKIHFYWKWGSRAGNVDSVRIVLQYTKTSA